MRTFRQRQRATARRRFIREVARALPPFAGMLILIIAVSCIKALCMYGI